MNLDWNTPAIVDINVFHFISGLNAWAPHDDSTFTLSREICITDADGSQSFVQPLNIHIDSADTLSLDKTAALFFHLNNGIDLRVTPLGLSPVTDWGSGVTGTLQAEFSLVSSLDTQPLLQPTTAGVVPLPSATWMGGTLLAGLLVVRRIHGVWGSTRR